LAGLIFAASAVLGSRFPAIKFAWFNYILMISGAVMVNLKVFMGEADVMFTSYPPLQAAPAYYLGIILFAVGALFYCFQFLFAIGIAKKEGWQQGSLPLFTFGLVVAAIIAIYTLIQGAITFIPTFLWSLEIIPHEWMMANTELYRINFWGFGHSAQQINLAAMVSIWYFLGTLTVGSKPVNEKFSRWAFLLYLVGINLGSVHHALVDPGLTSTYRIVNTSYLAFAAVIGSLIHALSVPAAIETAQRKKGLTNGLFEWLTKGPWSNPAWSGLWISLIIFGFIGGVTGVIMSVEQLNVLHHNNLRLPGHFHATVVGGTSLAFMVLAYSVIKLVLQRQLIGEKIAKFQPYVFGVGILLLITGMTFSGIMGVPRRHWDISLVGGGEIFQEAGAMLSLIGIGGIVAFIGLLMFIMVAVLSVFFGKKIPPKNEPHNPPYVAG
ncbi:MAG: cbb3-type cytochrome c oxidase subunit I, partial [Spirochaetota bacterium]|nr:cbb3-type cytochrome c oxidase subunit I [Spirochaetota bacterium]